MHVCNSCNKKYESDKKLMYHLERCEQRTHVSERIPTEHQNVDNKILSVYSGTDNNMEIAKLRKQYVKKLAQIKRENENVDHIIELEKTIRTLKHELKLRQESIQHSQDIHNKYNVLVESNQQLYIKNDELAKTLEITKNEFEIVIEDLTFKLDQSIEYVNKTKEHNETLSESTEQSHREIIEQLKVFYESQLNTVKSQLTTELEISCKWAINNEEYGKINKELKEQVAKMNETIQKDTEIKKDMSSTIQRINKDCENIKIGLGNKLKNDMEKSELSHKNDVTKLEHTITTLREANTKMMNQIKEYNETIVQLNNNIEVQKSSISTLETTIRNMKGSNKNILASKEKNIKTLNDTITYNNTKHEEKIENLHAEHVIAIEKLNNEKKATIQEYEDKLIQMKEG